MGVPVIRAERRLGRHTARRDGEEAVQEMLERLQRRGALEDAPGRVLPQLDGQKSGEAGGELGVARGDGQEAEHGEMELSWRDDRWICTEYSVQRSGRSGVWGICASDGWDRLDSNKDKRRGTGYLLAGGSSGRAYCSRSQSQRHVERSGARRPHGLGTSARHSGRVQPFADQQSGDRAEREEKCSSKEASVRVHGRKPEAQGPEDRLIACTPTVLFEFVLYVSAPLLFPSHENALLQLHDLVAQPARDVRCPALECYACHAHYPTRRAAYIGFVSPSNE
ncbi:unnamed protein product [Cutaneotrichosporon oleaginosum]